MSVCVRMCFSYAFSWDFHNSKHLELIFQSLFSWLRTSVLVLMDVVTFLYKGKAFYATYILFPVEVFFLPCEKHSLKSHPFLWLQKVSQNTKVFHWKPFCYHIIWKLQIADKLPERFLQWASRISHWKFSINLI